ncbi:hypothetical protein MKW94_014670 [Papaver nudicaule]|uniref:Glycosyl transferase CAP10 domain-containing protein n=1 Tax=Papaver nudicaule TaxID=74823 RepID=A0AA41VHX8_PAPNU|nr:hypothetical protein [Papaver nudicaule]
MTTAILGLAPERNTTAVLTVFIVVLFVGVYLYSDSIDSNILTNTSFRIGGTQNSKSTVKLPREKVPNRREAALSCVLVNQTYSCPVSLTANEDISSSLSTEVCPEYFRWIHEDLQPWRNTGITEEAVNSAKRRAGFRLVIVNGKAYVETYKKALDYRDTFSLWGILQLLRKYPKKLPDLDLMFDSHDRPVIKFKDYQGPNATSPPPIFRYCNHPGFMDLVLPDWSFWDPYAYWKGNPNVAGIRKELMRCNVSEKQDWNARIYAQDWAKETQKDFHESNLANQCTHRYKIYIEGSAWSVSEKYILACDSLTLLITPKYHDFYTRSLLPMKHYWPIKYFDKCKSIKFAVEWGKNHTEKVKEMGKTASNFIQEELKMDYIYDYLYHHLNEYSKLLRYKPVIPPNAVEFCSETMLCPAEGLQEQFMVESMVKHASETGPCTMPPPFDALYLQSFFRQKTDSIREVEMWENKYWESQPK